ncbi:tol-pal system protein YbgF [Thiocapsa rosea]|uniref:Cell division coordinator CpoB n=1 Tax=Thiocapsa rosea TaxID=69360 RepID=A0A495V8Z9_9GAMM|nr:tol-pal system protein YbgF [Thiocapsa rosea]RKT45210.1 tol-pal system protein YbgF [Thiocapsa rosea]
MGIRPIVLIVAAALVAAALPATSIANPALEARLARMERILENQAGSELLLQMQQFQMEMQELRGLVEMQQFEIQKLQRQQRDQFLDIDSRLGSDRGDPAGSAAPGDPNGGLGTGSIDVSGSDLDAPAGTPEPPPPMAAPVPSSSGAAGIPSLPSPETTGGSERDAYAAAFELLKERKYDEAQAGFNDLLRRYPQGQFTDNARYWLGETYYVQRNYPAALAELDRLVQLSPDSPKVPGAMLKIGYIQFEQKAFDQARATLEQVVSRYPASTEARLARSRLERIGQELR